MPEALEVMDEFGADENGEWLLKKLEEHQKNTDFTALEIVEINLGRAGGQAIIDRLNKNLQIKADVVQAGKGGESDGV